MKGWRLVWLPPIFLGLAALAIPASMHTGHGNYDAWQALRGTLLGAAFVYVGLVLAGRLAWAPGLWVHRPGPTKTGLTRCATCSDLRAMPDRCPKCGTAAAAATPTEVKA